MAMNWTQIERHLRDRGFYYVRDARHGQLWTNGSAFVQAPTPSSSRKSYSAERNFLAQVERAQRIKHAGKYETENEWHERIGPLYEELEQATEEARLREEIGEFLRTQLREARTLLRLYAAKYPDDRTAVPFFECYQEDV